MTESHLIKKKQSLQGSVANSKAPIDKGSVIEECPVVVIPTDQKEALLSTVIGPLLVSWGPSGDQRALPLGRIALYAHSDLPNAAMMQNYEDNTIILRALCDIPPTEDIVVYDPNRTNFTVS